MGTSDTTGEAARAFRSLVESADRKFVRVRDVAQYGRLPCHYFHSVFKAYTRLWKFQQEKRARLVEAGLQRWEIGEIASRIGQLYYAQYMRTSEARFLLESYVFYEAILNRGYFQGAKGAVKDLSLRYKELRFYARFLVVSLVLNRSEMVKILVDRFRTLVDDCKATFRETTFKEWKQVVQEIFRFLKFDTDFMHIRPLRYCMKYDSHQASLPFVNRFHAKRVLKLHDALLTSYHRNEVRFTELTLDTFRMLQCLEWEPSGSFFQVRAPEPISNGALNDQTEASGLIDINLSMDMTDPTLPPNPKKAILYRPSVTHLITVLATICEELPPESILLLYISASGKAGRNSNSQMDGSGAARNSTNVKTASQNCQTHDHSQPGAPIHNKENSSDCIEDYLFLGPRGGGGLNNLYPGDLIPFTRRPLFLIIDSDNSHAFKVLHGAERGEKSALLISPQRLSIPHSSAAEMTENGSQFTLFLTAPLQAFCHLAGLSPSNTDMEIFHKADTILSSAFSDWEVKLCTSTSLDLAWAQVLSDQFLRRLILRFVFCRAVLFFFCPKEEDREQYLPECLPQLPDFVSPNSEVVRSNLIQLANSLETTDCFHFDAS